MSTIIRSLLLLTLIFIPLEHVIADDEGDFKISKAKWVVKKSLLVVNGKAEKKSSVEVKNGEDFSTVGQALSNRKGRWRVRVSMDTPPCTVQAVSGGETAVKRVDNAEDYCHEAVASDDDETNPGSGSGSTGGSSGSTGGGSTPTPAGDYVTLANNDLGMHCADLDYSIFSILPFYNVVHGQVIQKGAEPRIMDSSQVDLYYRASPNPSDTVPPDVITTTSHIIDGKAKTNFWISGTGRHVFDTLYPSGVLDNFSLPGDTGLPAPDVERLYLGDGTLAAHQQKMPGTANSAQPFLGFLGNYPFFSNLPFGYIASDLKRFAAEGIPEAPLADPDSTGQFVESTYPLMQVTAVSKDQDPTDPANHVASVRTVLPVAAEADCQLCHADQTICAQSSLTAGQACDDLAAYNAPAAYNPVTPGELASVPGDSDYQMVVNAAKINILRLHDAKHGTGLDARREVVCAQCHYSPALDLAQLGPNDDNGKEQTQHISMSRAMHGYHGQFSDIFPAMPDPGNRDLATVEDVLGKTCYACHPGKRTQCLRGAMTRAGIVCQDCHGNMPQVGNDFSEKLAQNGPHTGAAWKDQLDWSRRVPWASEPGCQSCHTGDALDNLAGASDTIAADDGIRLLRAYRTGDNNATPILASNRRFAETSDSQGKHHLYRLSKGHGGVMCEGCHGSTHAIWPNPWAPSNDNLTATDLQGHSGKITECTTCHGNADLGLTLEGPHGMHPVGSSRWNEKHEDMAEKNSTQCKSCHGRNGEGTVLSRTATDRQWICKDSKGSLCAREDQRISVAKGTQVACTQCHENKINGD